MVKKVVQAVEEAAPDEAAVPVPSRLGALNRPLPSGVVWALAAFALLALVILVPFVGALSTYRNHFTGNASHVQVQFETLSAHMDEAALRQHFKPWHLNCLNDERIGGTRVCYMALHSANGIPALTLGFFLEQGRLNTAFLHVPWWVHGRMQDALDDRWPGRMPSVRDPSGKELRRWRLANGYLHMNENRYLHPLQWSAVFWTPVRAEP